MTATKIFYEGDKGECVTSYRESFQYACKSLHITCTYLHLFQWDFEAEGFIVVRVQGVLLHCRLLFLQTLTPLQELDLDIRI